MESTSIIEKFMAEYTARKREHIFSLNSDFDGELKDKNHDDEKSFEIDFFSLYGKKTAIYSLCEEINNSQRPKLIFNHFKYQDCDYDSDDVYTNVHKDIPTGFFNTIRIKPVSEDELYIMRRRLFDEYIIDTKRFLSEFVYDVKKIEEFYVRTFKETFPNDSIEKIREIVEVYNEN
jgi:hypothetical protein